VTQKSPLYDKQRELGDKKNSEKLGPVGGEKESFTHYFLK
jgi:hypothetical protein